MWVLDGGLGMRVGGVVAECVIVKKVEKNVMLFVSIFVFCCVVWVHFLCCVD